MTFSFRLAVGLALSAAIAIVDLAPAPLLAQQVTPTPDPDRPTTPDKPVVPDKPVTPERPTPGIETRGEPRETLTGIRVNRSKTADIVGALAAFETECSQYDPVYRIDCLRQGIRETLSRLPRDSEYRQARQILEKAAKKLDRIVAQNADPSVPMVVSPEGINPVVKKRRRYKAIRKDRLADANAQAIAVIEEARTELLRSTENSERRYRHYQQIAQAVDSTKVLLRSS